nr:MAG TPA: hypothetical protein [Caudoviricetes sp.]DAN46645.1 MAG TPA: hypothetical protein [Caudoviricetes sp.]DAP31086.1 MAG TPA: hypothetical protein [Caudoviricetes sp.]DAP57949.1 MAG TPA: hypothetical protein [Caudoviricetes sp.]DAQ78557.1 MAG TPA: hypothetical protein [Caudoviricetes sp.]
MIICESNALIKRYNYKKITVFITMINRHWFKYILPYY